MARMYVVSQTVTVTHTYHVPEAVADSPEAACEFVKNVATLDDAVDTYYDWDNEDTEVLRVYDTATVGE